MSKKRALLSILLLLLVFLKPLYAEKTGLIQSEEVIVQFEGPLRKAAQEVNAIYPTIKAELENTFRWKLDFRPTVMIIKDRSAFQRMAVSNLIVAYAVPKRNLIVIDYSKMNTHPFSIRVTLKHELCHLLLHHHIREGTLPKWLDEGIAQWVSGGIAEILMGGKGAALKQASLSGTFISMRDLTKTFPREDKSLLLAYEETKSIVEFIVSEFGVIGIRKVVNHLRDGDAIEGAIVKGFSIPLDELEKRWHGSLRTRITWFTYFSNNLYPILFFLAGLVTVYGFIRFLTRKRAYRDEEEETTDQ